MLYLPPYRPTALPPYRPTALPPYRPTALPPYRPDLNPIEQVFAKRKAWLRKIAKRTLDTLWDAVGDALNLFSSSECSNYFRHSGYHQPYREML